MILYKRILQMYTFFYFDSKYFHLIFYIPIRRWSRRMTLWTEREGEGRERKKLSKTKQGYTQNKQNKQTYCTQYCNDDGKISRQRAAAAIMAVTCCDRLVDVRGVVVVVRCDKVTGFFNGKLQHDHSNNDTRPLKKKMILKTPRK